MEAVPSKYVWRELMRGATDEFLKRPLWEFPPEQRLAIVAERAVRWGVPDDERAPDPEYH